MGADGDLWEAMDLRLERMEGKVEVHWVRGHADDDDDDEQAPEGKCESGCKLYNCQEGEKQGQAAAVKDKDLEAVL